MSQLSVRDLICIPGRTGYFSDDQAAIRANAEHDGFTYVGRPVTPGFEAIRVPGEALSVLLMLDDGRVAHGDCASVQYAGAGGRAPLFRPTDAAGVIATHVRPWLIGREVGNFRSMSQDVDAILTKAGPLDPAIRYGVTQALLDAAAQARGVTMAEVVRDDYATGAPLRPVPVFAQSGEDRYANVDKMILKRVDALPHGLINNTAKVGTDGTALAAYVEWVRGRILSLRSDNAYAPVLHFDVYGTIGLVFDADTTRIRDYLMRLEQVAAPFSLRVEQPVHAGSRQEQLEVMAELRAVLRAAGSRVGIAVDEWCNTLEDIRAFSDAGAADVIHVKTPDLGGVGNTVEALLYVRSAGLSAYCGGTCNETDRSAQVCAHVAMACEAAQVLAKPGMGVDEGLMIVGNEMARTAALAASRTLGTRTTWSTA